MKIFLQIPGCIEFRLEREPHQPMDDGHFYALLALAAGAMVFGFLLLSAIL